MAKYRKKPVVIEAVECWKVLRDAAKDWSALPDWIKENYEVANIILAPDAAHIHTAEGRMIAQAGDWIIRGVKGEIYPCKPDIFAATYDAVVERLEHPTIADLERVLEEPAAKVHIHPDGSVTTEQ